MEVASGMGFTIVGRVPASLDARVCSCMTSAFPEISPKSVHGAKSHAAGGALGSYTAPVGTIIQSQSRVSERCQLSQSSVQLF